MDCMDLCGEFEMVPGMDVARKVVVLARECGMDISLEDLDIQSLVPDELKSVESADAFMERLPEVKVLNDSYCSYSNLQTNWRNALCFLQFDEEILKQVMEAESEGAVLRYVGVVDVDRGECQVALKRCEL